MQVLVMLANVATSLNAVQLAAHIETKAGRVVQAANLSHCANGILNHPGGNAAGGALGGLQYKGNAVYHESRNLGAAGQRCSVFFADSGNGLAKILAVGEHTGQNGPGHPVYAIDWVSPDWRPGANWVAGGNVVL